MANFLHGVETIEINKGPRPIQVVKSAVIGLVGIAPLGPKNTLALVSNETQAAQFGEQLPGFTIPQALSAIFDQGAGTVLVVNVFNETTHTTQVTDETKTVTAGKIKLDAAPIGAVTIKDNAGAAVSYVPGTDYTIDAYGNFVVLSAVITNGTVLKFSYKKLNGAAVTDAEVIGSINGTTGARTGMKCWTLGKNEFGYNPKILIAPSYSSVNAIAAELRSQADTLKAICLLDAPYGTTVAQAITGRGIAGTINFNTSSKRAYLLYPYLKAFDPATGNNIDKPYSQFMAGVIAATDNTEGYWVSPSNKEIKGIVGTERPISAGISDAQTDANTLNEAGITTIFNTFGTGIRTWGNRSAAFPTNTAPDNFVSIRRTVDVVEESLENASLQFVDAPINTGLIDSVKESVNSFIRILVGRGALVDGVCSFDKNENPPEELAAGKLKYSLSLMPPPPAERITFNTLIDINLLKALF